MEMKKEFHDLMEHLNTYIRLNQNYLNSLRYYGIEEHLYQTEVHVVEYIGNNPGLSLMELAELTIRTKSSMSTMISKLSKKGLVTRERTDEDNRRYSINLTEKGQKVYDYHEKLDALNYEGILKILVENSDISEEELAAANKVCKGLIKSVLKHEFTEL